MRPVRRSTSCTRTTGSSPARPSGRRGASSGRGWSPCTRPSTAATRAGSRTIPQSHIHAAERAMVRRADHVITCSRYMRVPRRQRVRRPAVEDHRDPERDRPARPRAGRRPTSPALRARYAEPDELLVLLVGRLVYEKGFHLALDALAPIVAPARRRALRRRRHGHRRGRAQAPGPPARARPPRRVPRLDRRRHAPFALPALATSASCPRSTSRSGSSRSRRWRPGCLCVVADTGGLREVVPVEGTVGLRFPSRDAAALRGVLERVLTDDASAPQLVAEAREHVLRFDWAEVAPHERRLRDAGRRGAYAIPRTRTSTQLSV